MRKLVLMRHGESQWNLENRFTGWTDVDLTEKGEAEAKNCGLLLREAGFQFDIVHTSLLKRANHTMEICLHEMGLSVISIKYNWRLNERHYGALQGLNKAETAEKFGKEQVHIWRRSYDTPPPNGESLKDVVQRVSPYFTNHIKPLILNQKNILIVAHGNSLRAIMIEVGLHKPVDISSIELPTGSPFCLVYEEGKVINDYYLD